jgi:hypothetical protein
MSVINISIKRGLKQIYGWMIHLFNTINNERTIEQFYNDLPLDVLSEENRELEVKAFLGKHVNSVSNGVVLNCPIADATKNFGQCIEFRLQDIPRQSSVRKNAFDVLLQESNQCYLPKMKENGNEKECMIFDFVNYLQKNNAEWVGKDVAENPGRKFIKYIIEAIWYVNMCGVKKLKDQGYSIPKQLDNFFECANPAKYKKKRPDFDKDVLNEHISNLIAYKEAKWFNKPLFNWFKETFIEFLDSLVSYVLYLDNQTRIMNENHTLDKSIYSIADSGTTIIYNANKFRSSDVVNKYETLVNVLQELEYWILLDVSPYCSSNPM